MSMRNCYSLGASVELMLQPGMSRRVSVQHPGISVRMVQPYDAVSMHACGWM